MVTMQCLTFRRWIIRVESTGICNYRTTDSETALFINNYGITLICTLGKN